MLDSFIYMTMKFLKKEFWRDNIKILPSFKQRYDERHSATFIDFIALRYTIPRRDVMR